MRRFCVAFTAALAGAAFGVGVDAQLAAKPAAAAKLPLTVDSIMRGPDLVGWPPTGLRWSADSRQLFFQWRRPGDKEAATYVVDRSGGDPRRLSDEDARQAPAVAGRWDAARRRVAFIDAGDVVVIDGARRIQVTRTTAVESNPRWAREDTHVTFVRDNNLFIVPVEGPGNTAAVVTQLTDVAAKRAEPRLTDSQKFIKDEEQRLFEFLREKAEEKKRAEEKEKALKLPPFELEDRQSAT